MHIYDTRLVFFIWMRICECIKWWTNLFYLKIMALVSIPGDRAYHSLLAL